MKNDTSPKSREFWKEYGREHGHEATAELMYDHAPGLLEGTPETVVETMKSYPDFVNEFEMVDVLAFAVYQISSAPTWEVVEEIGGINEDDFYYMFNMAYTQNDSFGIPLKEKA